MSRKLVKGEFDLEDFLKQLQQVKKMGPLTQLLEMIPGMGRMTKDMAPDVTDKQMRRIEAIINSMTREERHDPRLLNGSRKRRMARGSGATVPEVNDLLNQFRQMQRLMKQMSSGGRGLRRRAGQSISLITPVRFLLVWTGGLQAFGTLSVPYQQGASNNGTYSSAPTGRQEAADLSCGRGRSARAA